MNLLRKLTSIIMLVLTLQGAAFAQALPQIGEVTTKDNGLIKVLRTAGIEEGWGCIAAEDSNITPETARSLPVGYKVRFRDVPRTPEVPENIRKCWNEFLQKEVTFASARLTHTTPISQNTTNKTIEALRAELAATKNELVDVIAKQNGANAEHDRLVAERDSAIKDRNNTLTDLKKAQADYSGLLGKYNELSTKKAEVSPAQTMSLASAAPIKDATRESILPVKYLTMCAVVLLLGGSAVGIRRKYWPTWRTYFQRKEKKEFFPLLYDTTPETTAVALHKIETFKRLEVKEGSIEFLVTGPDTCSCPQCGKEVRSNENSMLHHSHGHFTYTRMSRSPIAWITVRLRQKRPARHGYYDDAMIRQREEIQKLENPHGFPVEVPRRPIAV